MGMPLGFHVIILHEYSYNDPQRSMSLKVIRFSAVVLTGHTLTVMENVSLKNPECLYSTACNSVTYA